MYNRNPHIDYYGKNEITESISRRKAQPYK